MVKTYKSRLILGISFSILVHVVVLLYILNINLFEEETKKISIDDFTIFHQEIVEPHKVAKEFKYTKPKAVTKPNAQMIKKEPLKIQKTEELHIEKQPKPEVVIQNENAKIIEKKNPLVEFFRKDLVKDKKEEKQKSNISLYSEDFETLSPVQQTFILNNLDLIQAITQSNLIYPELAQRYNISGMNIVEFNFHPDGSISNLRLIGSSNTEVLDVNSLETILISYKDYPYPQETTVIRFYIRYIIR